MRKTGDFYGRTYPGTVLKNVLKNKLYTRKQTMKKRIISLILVVALAFLTLTGCAYNYAKDDVSEYATLDFDKFYSALQALSIEDGDFGTDEATRLVKVEEAIAAAILKVTDTTDKKFAGNVEKYDSLYFCYFAMDEDGNVFYAAKMDETKATNLQVGVTSLVDLNKAISDGVISAGDIADHIYSTSSASVAGKGDAISLSYVKTWLEGDQTKTEKKYNDYVVLGENNELHAALIGKQVGVTLDEIKVTENEIECTYSEVKIESIVKDNSSSTVADGDTIFVTYTYSFDATPWFDEETSTYKLPEGFSASNVDGEGNYKATVSYEALKAVADVPAEGSDTVAADDKTFIGQLVGKTAGSTTSSITEKKGTVGDQTVEIKYTNVKVNWIVNEINEAIEIKYTPYPEALNEEKTNKKTETNTYGDKIELNEKELTYYVFPVYYLDVEKVSAELILREFYSTVNATQTKEHDHTEEEHEHETEYVFDILNDDEYKNGDKTLAALVGELVTLNSTITTKEKAVADALKALTTAQSNLAKDAGTSESETASLKTKLQNATKDYLTAKTAADNAEKEVEEKIDAILACKKGETGVAEGLVENYETYQYDALEAAYKSDINNKIAAKVIEYLEKNVTFEGNLPKRAVKNAYKAIMNTYKYDFYEGKYSATGSTTSTSTETNFAHYNGDFDLYLIDKVTNNKGDMDDVKANIQKEAEDTVKDIIIIYVFANAVEEKWEGADVTLTKDEKKEIKKNLENTALLYQQYGLSFTYNVDDSYHAGQFDKAMNYLLEVDESMEDVVLDVIYKHVSYTTEAEDK